MTSSWADTHLQVLEEQITKRQDQTQMQATVQSVESATFQAVVVPDDSTVGVPVLVAAHAGCVAGDRVCIQRFGSQWVVVANVSALRWPDTVGFNGNGAIGAAIGAWANLPGAPTASRPLAKRWNATRVKWTMLVTAYATAWGSIIEAGVTYNNGSTTIKVAEHEFANTVAGAEGIQRITFGGIEYESGLVAGEYTIKGRWKGAANQTAQDWVSFTGEEVAP